MKKQFFQIGIALSLALTPGVHAAGTQHHELKVRLFPSEHRIEATDRVTLPGPAAQRRISLNPDLKRTVKWLDDSSYEVIYNGVIDYPLRSVGEEYARGQKDTSGSIGQDGVYLDGGSGWYPQSPKQPDEKITFDLTVQLPPGWDAVSQGTRTGYKKDDSGTVVRWVCEQPHQQMKQELGLDDFEGRTWLGLQHHALMTMIAFLFLQHLRLQGKKNSRSTARLRA